MNLNDFDYPLPDAAIARYPAPRREDARLLCINREGRLAVRHHFIRELPNLLRSGDLLVINDTRVQPWRLRARRPSGGKVEVLLLRREGDRSFRAMVSANRPLPEGEEIRFPGGRTAILGPPGEERRVTFSGDRGAGLDRWIGETGEIPIPPYLGRAPEPIDGERYQTVYARAPGAVAAPTAGLHLTPAILRQIRSAGVEVAFLTLHVGPGTFRPVKTDRIEEHEMDSEAFELPAETVERIETTRRAGGRVVGVGTTVVRTLESVGLEAARSGKGMQLKAGSGEASIFIRPGHRFRCLDALLTNFHLPRSTLLMLVAAFAGRERILKTYRIALEEGYRFFSYGDAMLIE